MDTLKIVQRTLGLARSLGYPLLCLTGFCLAGQNLASCTAFWPEMAATIVLPAFPPVWSSADAWELDWRSKDAFGVRQVAEPGETLVLFLPRTGIAAIRCKPVFGIARGLPYGAVWPLHTDPGGTLVLSPQAGLSAELAFLLYQAGYDAENFNLGRFAVEAELRMADPWESDLAGLARAVAEKRFRADYLRTPARTPVVISGLLGTMAPGSPWGQVLQPDEQGQVVLTSSAGVHRWFGADQELVVSVSPEGSSEWILRGSTGRLMEKVLP